MKLALNLLCVSFIFVALQASADPVAPQAARQMLPQTQHSIEWDNNSPEQRQALDSFYYSLQQQQLQNSLDQRLLRQERIEQLRDMTPEQRQQQIIDFAQQYQQHRQLLMPTQ